MNKQRKGNVKERPCDCNYQLEKLPIPLIWKIARWWSPQTALFVISCFAVTASMQPNSPNQMDELHTIVTTTNKLGAHDSNLWVKQILPSVTGNFFFVLSVQAFLCHGSIDEGKPPYSIIAGWPSRVMRRFELTTPCSTWVVAAT